MAWWGWITIGAFLMGAELLGVDAAFYLIFVGVAGLIVGLLGLFGIDLPVWSQWLLFGVLAIASMVLFRAKLYDRIRGGAVGFANTLVGEIVEVTEDIASGQRARVKLRGSVWTAINVSDQPIASGQSATVVEAGGTELKISELQTQTNQRGK